MNLPTVAFLLTLPVAIVAGAFLNEPVHAEGGAPVEIGEAVPAENLHIVTEPRRYGLGPELPGSHYAIIGNTLVRIDAETSVVQSIIRKVEGILD